MGSKSCKSTRQLVTAAVHHRGRRWPIWDAAVAWHAVSRVPSCSPRNLVRKSSGIDFGVDLTRCPPSCNCFHRCSARTFYSPFTWFSWCLTRHDSWSPLHAKICHAHVHCIRPPRHWLLLVWGIIDSWSLLPIPRMHQSACFFPRWSESRRHHTVAQTVGFDPFAPQICCIA